MLSEYDEIGFRKMHFSLHAHRMCKRAQQTELFLNMCLWY